MAMTINRVRICFTWPLSSRVLQCFHKATIRLYCWCCCGILCKSKLFDVSFFFFLLLIWHKITWKWKKKKCSSVILLLWCQRDYFPWFCVSLSLSAILFSAFLDGNFHYHTSSMRFPKKVLFFLPIHWWILEIILHIFLLWWFLIIKNTTPHQGVQKASLFYVFLLISWFPHLPIVIANNFFFLCGNFFFETRKKQ